MEPSPVVVVGCLLTRLFWQMAAECQMGVVAVGPTTSTNSHKARQRIGKTTKAAVLCLHADRKPSPMGVVSVIWGYVVHGAWMVTSVTASAF